MALCRCVLLAAVLAVSGAVPAVAKAPVEPQAGVQLSGMIAFPREQRMTIQTDTTDGSRLTVAMGFDGRCKGGGLGELWAGNVRSAPEVRVRDGRLSASLTGISRALGQGRTGVFKWKLTGRFTARDVVVATVTGSAEVRVNGRTVSKCRIARPASVRLAVRSA
jgi:hypothetical protein